MNGSTAGRRLFLLAAIVVAGVVLFFPARQLVSQRERIDALEERRAALRAENQRLASDAARLSDPASLEVLARDRLGLVRPGERAYFVEPSGESETAPVTQGSRSAWSRAWAWLTSIVRGRN